MQNNKTRMRDSEPNLHQTDYSLHLAAYRSQTLNSIYGSFPQKKLILISFFSLLMGLALQAQTITVSGSGCEPFGSNFPVDGVYTLSGQINGKDYYVHSNNIWWILWCTNCVTNETNPGNGFGWVIIDQGNGGTNPVYFTPEDTSNPPATGWTVYLTGVTLCPAPVPTLSGNVALPVELSLFTGKLKNGDSVELSWETASELNNEGFQVEHSPDGATWDDIAFVEGHGTSAEAHSYKFTHNISKPGLNYYRLKQIDFDGSIDFSKTILVENKAPKHLINLYPNPTGKNFRIKIDNPSRKEVKITICNSWGKKVWEGKLSSLEPQMKKEFEIEESGLYFITTQIGENIFSNKILIKGNEK